MESNYHLPALVKPTTDIGMSLKIPIMDFELPTLVFSFQIPTVDSDSPTLEENFKIPILGNLWHLNINYQHW